MDPNPARLSSAPKYNGRWREVSLSGWRLAYELGLVGVGLLMLTLGTMVSILLSTLVSGDFYDSRLLWLLGFALLGLRGPAPADGAETSGR